MPWTKDDYPNSMKNLDKPVRDKAIDIANALLKEGYEEGRAIPIAIDQAREWADDHLNKSATGTKGNTSNSKKNETTQDDDKHESHDNHTNNTSANPSQTKAKKRYHLVPHNDGWAIKKEHSDRALYLFHTKKEAMSRARSLSDNDSHVVIHKSDGTIEDTI